MNFIIVGCGRVGAELCHHLFTRGHHVVVVDINKESFNRLHPDFRGRTLEGEGLAEGVLERAGIREADGLAAVTNSDTLNAVVAHAARTIFNVPNVVARNYDPNLRTVIEAFGSVSVAMENDQLVKDNQKVVDTFRSGVADNLGTTINYDSLAIEGSNIVFETLAKDVFPDHLETWIDFTVVEAPSP